MNSVDYVINTAYKYGNSLSTHEAEVVLGHTSNLLTASMGAAGLLWLYSAGVRHIRNPAVDPNHWMRKVRLASTY